jgi:hypothetical protein
MATRLYLHKATSTNTGTLPSTKQSSKTTTGNLDAQTVNRSMDTTIGTSQQTISASVTTVGSISDAYITRFLSGPFNTNITAQTWTINFAIASNSSQWTWIDSSSNGADGGFRVCAYVWRPSTGAKVANIFDGLTSAVSNTQVFGSYTEKSMHVTISGSAVTVTNGDIIAIEFFDGHYTVLTSTDTLYLDGTTVNTSTAYPSVSNHASFIETPDTLTFVGGAITATVTGKTNTNKFIKKV